MLTESSLSVLYGSRAPVRLSSQLSRTAFVMLLAVALVMFGADRWAHLWKGLIPGCSPGRDFLFCPGPSGRKIVTSYQERGTLLAILAVTLKCARICF